MTQPHEQHHSMTRTYVAALASKPLCSLAVVHRPDLRRLSAPENHVSATDPKRFHAFH